MQLNAYFECGAHARMVDTCKFCTHLHIFATRASDWRVAPNGPCRAIFSTRFAPWHRRHRVERTVARLVQAVSVCEQSRSQVPVKFEAGSKREGGGSWLRSDFRHRPAAGFFRYRPVAGFFRYRPVTGFPPLLPVSSERSSSLPHTVDTNIPSPHACPASGP